MITVIGAGRVGSSTALRLSETGLDDVTLIDIVEGLPMGEALDISQSCTFDVELNGSNNFEDMMGSDLIINTAGLARKPGMTRLDLTNKNAEITRSIAEKIRKYCPSAIVLQVANPVDLMALVQLKTTGFPKERVIGMGGMLDSLRFRYFISEEAKISSSKVDAMVLGEHGDTMVPLKSTAKIGLKRMLDVLTPGQIADVMERTNQAGAEVIRLKGATFFAPSRAISLMAESIIKNKRAVLPTSAYLEGEYNVSGIYAGVPARLGKNGLEEIIKLELTNEEEQGFQDSCRALKKKADQAKLL